MHSWLMATGIRRKKKQQNKQKVAWSWQGLSKAFWCVSCLQILARITRNLKTFIKPWASCHSSVLLWTRKEFGWALCVLSSEWYFLVQYSVDERSRAVLNILKSSRKTENLWDLVCFDLSFNSALHCSINNNFYYLKTRHCELRRKWCL